MQTNTHYQSNSPSSEIATNSITQRILEELPPLVSTKRIADDADTTVNTIRSWIARGHMPQPDIRGNRFNRWRRETIAPFLADPLAWRRQHAEVAK